MVLCEEIKAQKLMAELRAILVKEDTNRVHLERAQVAKNKLITGGSLAQIESCMENLDLQIQQRTEIGFVILLKLQHLDGLLTSLPASERAKIQPCFDSLCADAGITLSKIADGIKILGDENQIRIQKLAATLKPSS